VDLEHAAEQLVNRRFAYVALSRARYDAQLYTDDKVELTEGLDRDISNPTAMQIRRALEVPEEKIERVVSLREKPRLTISR